MKILHSFDDSTFASLIKVVQLLHFFGGQIEVIDVCVLNDSRRGIALGQWNPILLQSISDQDMTCRLFMSCCNRFEGRVVGFQISNKRTVGLDDDFILVAEVDYLSLL